MYRTIVMASFFALMGLTQAHAQVIVNDPVLTGHEIQADYQIIEALKKKNEVLGEPAHFIALDSLSGLPELILDFSLETVLLFLGELLEKLTGEEIFHFSSGEVFEAIGEAIPLTHEQEAKRDEKLYRRNVLQARTLENHDLLQVVATGRITLLRRAVHKTIEDLRQATTELEIQKLQAVLTAQQAQLTYLLNERLQVAINALVEATRRENIDSIEDTATQEQFAKQLVAGYETAIELLEP